MAKGYRILYLSSWYPVKEDVTLGIFIKRHAIASSVYNEINIAYAHSDSTIDSIEVDGDTNEIRESILRYPVVKNKIPLIKELIKLTNYINYSFKAVFSLGLDVRKYDLIQVNIVYPAGMMALLLKLFYKIPYIVLEHWTGYLPSDGRYRGVLRKLLAKWVIKNASAVVTVSHDLKNEMLKRGLKNRYFIVPNTVDQKIFYAALNSPKISPDQTINILHISGLDDSQKNISGIIRVVERLKDSKCKFVLNIVGEGPERKKHELFCREKALLNSFVKFYGYKNEIEIAEMMRNSHFLLLFSNYENLPCVMLEAMMCGLPVISSNTGGVAEHLSKEKGIIVEVKNENQLYDAIQTMINNYFLYDKNEIYRYALEHFSNIVVGKQFSDIYKRILSKNERDYSTGIKSNA
jgi:glycosyltransferase involved in cell wall biosynthesis